MTTKECKSMENMPVRMTRRTKINEIPIEKSIPVESQLK